MNYVFPVQKKAADGYCSVLQKKFELSDPIAWPMLQHTTLPNRDIGQNCMENPMWKIQIAQGVAVPYLNTDFWTCEKKLSYFPIFSV
jgi:hypothetical protein